MASTSFPRNAKDWRGRFIYDMAAALAECGVDVSLWAPVSDYLPIGVNLLPSSEDAWWLNKLTDRGGMAYLLRQRPGMGLISAAGFLSRLNRACRRIRPDVYHINWLQSALALPHDGRPAIITVLGSDYGLLRILSMVRLLRWRLKRHKLIIMPNAAWMAPQLERYFGDIAEIRPNLFGVDRRWFEIARAPVEAGEDWLVVSRVTRAKLGYLLDWGEGLFDGTRCLHLFGPMQESIALPGWIKYHGPTHPTALQQHWFPVATGLITLSSHDEGRPQVVLEAMAAGLPVIASDLPAHADFLRQGQTGFLVKSRDQFATILNELDAAKRERLGNQARAWIRDEIGTWDDYGRRCVDAYQELLGQG